MNKDGHSIFEKYKNTSAKQQIVEEGMKDVLKSRNEQVITEIEKLPPILSKPTIIKDKYQNVILPRVIGTTADGGRTFITSRPDEYPSQVGLPKGATVDSEVHTKGATVDSEVHNLNSEDDDAGDPNHPDYAARKDLLNKRKYDKIGSGDHPLFANRNNFFDSRARDSALKIKAKYGVGGWANKKF